MQNAPINTQHSQFGPIGLFDSGIGGLSVTLAVQQALPNTPLIYVADHAHAPYGGQSEALIEKRGVQIIQWLIQQGAKAIVVACNTATVMAISAWRRQFQIPIIGVEPGIKPALMLSQSVHRSSTSIKTPKSAHSDVPNSSPDNTRNNIPYNIPENTRKNTPANTRNSSPENTCNSFPEDTCRSSPEDNATRQSGIAVLATQNTVQGPSFRRLVTQTAKQAAVQCPVILQACPGFAERVESGDWHSEAAQRQIGQVVTPLIRSGVNILVLGCTHYIFLKPLILNAAGDDIHLIDTSEAVARQVRRRLQESLTQPPVDTALAQNHKLKAHHRFYSTQLTQHTQDIVKKLWPSVGYIKSLPL